MARMRSLLARYQPDEQFTSAEPPGRHRCRTAFAARDAASRPRVVLFYGAKGGVGTTTIAINAAIALHKELAHGSA